MPFDIVGTSNAPFLSSDSDDSGKKKAPVCCGCCFFIVAICLVGAGASSLSASQKNERQILIDAFGQDVGTWVRTKGAAVAALKWTISSNGDANSSDAIEMRGERFELLPSSFGETTPLLKTPNPITDYRYVEYARCPGGVNATCDIELTAANGETISTSVMARIQVGPTDHNKTSTLCQWYDGDYMHPMASEGFGACNSDMRGGGNPEKYDYGPSRCVLDEYLDDDRCPNDEVPVQKLINYGWTWATHLSSQKRFQYNTKDDKCYDYTDCYCSCDDKSFKTDMTKGYGFTGLGYYANNAWVPFATPISSMDPDGKALQCRNFFDAIGQSCSKAPTLTCFHAGGYPKKKCSTYCKEQDSVTSVYQPTAHVTQMNTLYGPWGIQGSYPSVQTVHGFCKWTRTNTTRLTKLRVTTDDSGLAVVSPTVVSQMEPDKETESGSVPFPTPAPATVDVEVEVVAAAGPRIVAARATNGCNLKKNPGRKCFGDTPGDLRSRGFGLIGGGGVLVLLSCCCIVLGMRGMGD